MNKEERQLYNFIDKFKRHIQEHLRFKPTAIGNFSHLSDRILDKKDGCFLLFQRNIREMVRDSLPISTHGMAILEKLKVFVDKGKNINDFINVVYWIYEN